MSVIKEFEDEAALHPEGSRARKCLTWAAIELEDRRRHIEELEEDDDARLRECEQLRQCLTQAADQLELLAKYMRDGAFTIAPDAFARDFSGWINLMAGQGDPDYLKPDGQSIRHVDLREKAPRKKKETA